MSSPPPADLPLLRALVVGLRTSASVMHLHLGALRDALRTAGGAGDSDVAGTLDALSAELKRAERLAAGYERLSVPPALEKTRCRPATLLESAVQGFSVALRDEGVAVHRFEAAPAEAFLLDPAVVTTVFATLLRTSATAAGRGGSVTITTGTTSDAWTANFIDTGPGYPAHVAERFFDAACVEGPGDRPALGFARHAIAAHGGDVLCVSAEGMGTCLTVRLPKETGS